MDIYEILQIKINSPKEIVKQAYYKLLFQLHPHNHITGDEEKYMALQTAYKKHVSGDSFVNCFSVVTNDICELQCRCGGLYSIPFDFIGKIECDFCSCFIEVESPVKNIKAN